MVIKENLNEGVNYTAVLETTKDTSGKTLEAYVFNKRNSQDSGTLVGSTQGKPANKEIEILFNIFNLKSKHYLVEIWIDKDDPDNRELIYPNIGDEFYIKIEPNKGVNN